MKTRSILFTMMLAAAGFTFSQCGDKKEHSHEQADHNEKASEPVSVNEAGKPQFIVDVAFQQQLTKVFDAYVSLKDAFVSSDASAITASAATTREALSSADMKLLTGAAHNDWMNYLSGMETSIKTIESSSDTEARQEAFNVLSENLYKSIKAYGLGGETAYYDFCPMALDNQGAYWLSNSEEIRNPYFGDKMLTCGSVKETIK